MAITKGKILTVVLAVKRVRSRGGTGEKQLVGHCCPSTVWQPMAALQANSKALEHSCKGGQSAQQPLPHG